MKTQYNDIVNVSSIGKDENPISLNDILKYATNENMVPSSNDIEKNLFLAIDVQKDFMENRALGVPNSHKDVENMTRFIYNNIEKINQIAVSIDTHSPLQVFHPAWWIDSNGNNPAPYTIITLKDLDDGKWFPVIAPIESREYVENLEKLGKKQLCIWPYHCIQGTSGCALENQFANMVYFHSVARKIMVNPIVKGTYPVSEMYGIIKPEYCKKQLINFTFLNSIEKYDKIIIAGEAKSHCVLESIQQILDHYKNENKMEVLKKIYILEDCMSSIPGFEQLTEDTFNQFKNKFNVNIVKSTDLNL